MKFVCVQNKLQKALEQTSMTSSKNQELKVSGCFLITAENNKLVIQTTNIDLATQVEIPAQVTEPGTIAVPVEIFSKVVAGNKNSQEGIECSLEEENLHVVTKQNTTTIKTIPHEDFPTTPYITDGESMSLPIKQVVDGIGAVSFCAAHSNIKPELSSVFIYKEGTDMYFVCTDGFRLAEKRIPLQINKEDFSLLLPIGSADLITRMLEKIEDEIELLITYTENQISFSTDEVYITSRLVSGNFPDYKQLIPEDKNTSVVMLKTDVQDTLKLIGVFSDQFHEVSIEVKPKEKLFALYTQNKDVGQNQSKIDAALEGDDMMIKFNHRYIQDVFGSIGTDSVEMSFTEANRPLKIETVPKSGFTYIVMPLNK